MAKHANVITFSAAIIIVKQKKMFVLKQQKVLTIP